MRWNQTITNDCGKLSYCYTQEVSIIHDPNIVTWAKLVAVDDYQIEEIGLGKF